MKTLKASYHFKLGKHNIGYISSDFLYFGNTEFTEQPMPTFQTLPRDMADSEIESEMKVGLCELGDILAFLDNAPQECKDGNWNIFYMGSYIVSAFWYSDGRHWYVGTWRRGDGKWGADTRVLSRNCSATKPSDSLELRLSGAEKRLAKIEKLLSSWNE